MTNPTLAAASAQTLQQAATDLNVLANQQVGAQLATAMREASDALERLAADPAEVGADSDAADSLAVALSRLGEEVQKECDLPVG